MNFDELVIRDVEGERRLSADALPIRIGTSADCDIRLPGPGGSPMLLLDLLDGAPFVQPVGRDDAMRLNGEALVSSRKLRNKDLLDYFGSEIHVTAADSLLLDVRLEASAYVTQPPDIPELDGAAEQESIAPTAFTRAEASRPPVTPAKERPVKTLIGLALLVLAATSVLLFTSKSVQFVVDPGPAAKLEIEGAWFKFPLGDRVLMRPGTYTALVSKPGYFDVRQSFEVGDVQSQVVAVDLRRLPGQLVVNTDYTDGVTITVNGTIIESAPLGPVELQPGEHSIAITGERFLPVSDVVSIEGLGRTRVVNVQLIPRWSDVTLTSEPSGARVFDGENLLGETPLTIELLEGTHQLSIVAEGFRAWDGTVVAEPNIDQALPTVVLQPADAKLLVNSIPRGANVTVNGRYRGQSPLTLDLSPEVDYTIGLTRAGYGSATRQVRLRAAASDSITVDMTARTGSITVNVAPQDAEVIVDGRSRGRGTKTLALSSTPHTIEVVKPGYESWKRTLTPRPGYPQSVTANLRSLEAVRAASIAREVSTSQDALLRRVEPGLFSMGASRSQPGRRANEVIVPVRLSRPYLIGTREVTNREFREFRKSHDSGADIHITLAGDNNPVANVSWADAVQFCNWLSQKEGLPPVYKEEFGKWVPIYPLPDGYRLPTEAEWSWAVRYAGSPGATVFNWGNEWPPAEDSGNFADRSALELVPSVIPQFNDGFSATAPVGRFQANALGLYDGAGNVAEWVNDYYTVPTPGLTEPQLDPTGPARGSTYVIRGSSWRHAGQTELRLSYREAGTAARSDVGFRLARNVQ